MILREERIAQLINGRIVEITPSGCHIWTGGLNGAGYGVTRFEGRKHVRVHRLAWELANGAAVPSGMVIMHRCDVPCCVNPDHLEAGTQAENMRDMGRKGRARGGARGERQGSAKLTADAVREIRRQHGRSTSKELAARFGVDPSNIRLIWNRKGWAHVTD
jgi:hypothetical protein